MEQHSKEDPEALHLSRWEFNALLLESVLAGAVLFALMSWIGRRFLAPVHPWAVPAAFGVGLLLLMLALHPILSVHQRSVGRRSSGFGRTLAWSLLGSVVGAILFGVLS